MLTPPGIPEIIPTGSWYMTLLMFCWNRFGNILLRIFTSVIIKFINMQCSLWCLYLDRSKMVIVLFVTRMWCKTHERVATSLRLQPLAVSFNCIHTQHSAICHNYDLTFLRAQGASSSGSHRNEKALCSGAPAGIRVLSAGKVVGFQIVQTFSSQRVTTSNALHFSCYHVQVVNIL